jgi:RNA recognition motif-containing protein
VTEADLREEFGRFGRIANVKVVASGSYGFVTYEEHAAAVQAIVGMNGKELKGKVRNSLFSWL